MFLCPQEVSESWETARLGEALGQSWAQFHKGQMGGRARLQGPKRVKNSAGDPHLSQPTPTSAPLHSPQTSNPPSGRGPHAKQASQGLDGEPSLDCVSGARQRGIEQK